MNTWISVADRLPKKFAHVICFFPNKDCGSQIMIDYMESDKGYFATEWKWGAPTHWMPLPDLPIK